MRTRKVKKVIPPGVKFDVLQATHNAWYVHNKGLAATLHLNPVVTWRALKELEKGNFIRFVGEPIRCPFRYLQGKRFYTPTTVSLKDACEKPLEIKTNFRPQYRKHNKDEALPGEFLLVHRSVKGDTDPEPKVKGVKKKRNKQKTKEERIPLHRVGADASVGFFASVVHDLGDEVSDTKFFSEQELRRDKKWPMYPMPDGLFFVNGEENCYRIEFECSKKSKKRYIELFDQLERCTSPTVYIVLTPKLAVYLDGLASNRKNIAIVMLGDKEGCASALSGLNNDYFWQAPERYADGKKAGFDRSLAEAVDNKDVPPPGVRHLDRAAIARLKGDIPVLRNVEEVPPIDPRDEAAAIAKFKAAFPVLANV